MVDEHPADSEQAPSASSDRAQALGRAPVPGRLGMLTGMSLVAGAIPLPILPDRVLRQLRGAVAHEAASRHGLSLSSDARQMLARPTHTDRMRAVLRKGVELLTRRVLRRIGPLAPLSAAASAFEVYALGHLIDRYLTQLRAPGAARMHAAEAERLRTAIDTAVMRSFYPATTPSRLRLPEAGEDLRDEFTRWLDTVLVTVATLPSYLQRRLDAAFDEIVSETPERIDA